jgi:hypothetical protein
MGFARYVLVGLVTALFVPSLATAVTDPCTGTEAGTLARASGPTTSTGVTNVLWDLSHFPWYGYEPAVRYTSLVSDLAAEGLHVSTTTAGIQNLDLSPYAVVVLCAGSAIGTAYTAPEVAALQAFVSQGGGLLVMADNPEPDTGTPHLNPVTQAFGTACGASYLGLEVSLGDLTGHPIFTGIDSIFFQAGGELAFTAPSVGAAFSSDHRAGIVVSQTCGFVFTGDINFCDNGYIARKDNRRFAMNVFHWLADGCRVTPARRGTWGALKSTYH